MALVLVLGGIAVAELGKGKGWPSSPVLLAGRGQEG